MIIAKRRGIGRKVALWALVSCCAPVAVAGTADGGDGRWIADQGDGTYRNPVLAGDYSDPDAVRVGEDYYLVSSSFTDIPGLPILHSRDLVNWSIIGHALSGLVPHAHYRTPRRGGGVWAPSFRYHDGHFMIHYADPDRGIFMTKAADPRGPWSDPVLVDDTRGAIDPAPFWDDDGSAWLVHAYARSRSGRANVIVLKPMNADGTRVTGPERVIIDGERMPPVMTSLGSRPWQTTEGPKLYKRKGWYYVFAPSGSVKGGWQGVFRSRSLGGPYEGRNVLDQGSTAINGPHQGAWVTTPAGEDWFLHFQDRDSYGRVVWLEPMRWKNGWPVIGIDKDGDGRGEPALRYRKPRGPAGRALAPVADDDFAAGPSLAWQWGSNPSADWMEAASGGRLRLKAVSGSSDLYENGAVLSQKLPGERFTATVEMHFAPRREGEQAGLAIHGTTFAWIGARQGRDGPRIVRLAKSDPAPGASIDEMVGPTLAGDTVWLRLSAEPETITVPPPDFSPYWPSMLRETHMQVQLSYSFDGVRFVPLGAPFQTRPGRWVGTQIGMFAQSPFGTPSAAATAVGHANFDNFRITP
jgi:beta-xylosidase